MKKIIISSVVALAALAILVVIVLGYLFIREMSYPQFTDGPVYDAVTTEPLFFIETHDGRKFIGGEVNGKSYSALLTRVDAAKAFRSYGITASPDGVTLYEAPVQFGSKKDKVYLGIHPEGWRIGMQVFPTGTFAFSDTDPRPVPVGKRQGQ